MFYTNEIDLQHIDNKEEMVTLMYNNNITSDFEVTEIMAIPNDKRHRIELKEFKDTYTLEFEGIEVEFISSIKYIRYRNGATKLVETFKTPDQGYVIRRGNKAKNIESLRLDYGKIIAHEGYADIKAQHKKRVTLANLEAAALQILEARRLNIIDQELLKEYSLHVNFDNTPEEHKVEFLEAHNFRGLQNFDIYDERPDGYGHTTGRGAHIDFANRSIYLMNFSSDD